MNSFAKFLLLVIFLAVGTVIGLWILFWFVIVIVADQNGLLQP